MASRYEGGCTDEAIRHCCAEKGPSHPDAHVDVLSERGVREEEVGGELRPKTERRFRRRRRRSFFFAVTFVGIAAMSSSSPPLARMAAPCSGGAPVTIGVNNLHSLSLYREALSLASLRPAIIEVFWDNFCHLSPGKLASDLEGF